MWSPRKVYCEEQNKVYKSINQAEKQNYVTGIRHVLAGRQKTCGGLHWRYVDTVADNYVGEIND